MGIKRIEQDFTVCQVKDYSLVNLDSEYSFIEKTDEEKSLVCITSEVPKNTIQRDDGWKAFRIQGVLDFSLIGILAKIATILADNGISIFAVSTYNTDYVLIKKKTIKKHWKFFRLQDIRFPINKFQFVCMINLNSILATYLEWGQKVPPHIINKGFKGKIPC